jgi:hypothetical protein
MRPTSPLSNGASPCQRLPSEDAANARPLGFLYWASIPRFPAEWQSTPKVLWATGGAELRAATYPSTVKVQRFKRDTSVWTKHADDDS